MPIRVAISMGDPTGIGPEVTLAALADERVARHVAPILVGDAGVYRATARRLGIGARFSPWHPGDALPERGVTALCEVSRLAQRDRRPGHPCVRGGRAAYRAIVEATALVRRHAASALVTAPVSKVNLAAAGCTATGHTELLAELCGSDVRMMMVGTKLRVALVTTHLGLARVPGAITGAGIRNTVRIAAHALHRDFRIERPRIAVTGVNPHAGEGGLFGDEENRIIAPAVRTLRRSGHDVVGPIAADSAFPLAAAGRFDLVTCMYHDQGLAPFKLLHFHDGVNFTAGLPFVRTSPDHGTAHDIAGRGNADSRSMTAALLLSARTARHRETSPQ